MLLAVNEKNFLAEVIQSQKPVLVHFRAPWCGICYVIEPYLIKLQDDQQIDIKIVSVNADENFKLANTYRLKDLPTILLFEQGKLISRLEGFENRQLFREKLE
ncbi:MAG: thioredoxin, partial [Cyanobacteria bacterium J083]